MQRIATFLIILLTISFVGMAEEVQRTYIENVDFSPLAVGTKSFQQVVFRGITGVGKFDVKNPASLPFKFEGSTNDLIVVNGTITIKLSFNPFTEGDFQSEMLLARSPITVPENDEIKIRMRGAAFRLQRTDFLDFDRTLISDTTFRRVALRLNLNENVQWKLLFAPSKPFDLVNKNGPLVTKDTAAFVFSFAPHQRKVFTDSCYLVRSTLTGVVLDTIRVHLSGEGFDLGQRASVTFKPTLTADSIARPYGFVLRPNSPNYTYKVANLPRPPFAAILAGGLPKLFTADSALLVFTYEPMDTGEHEDSLVISRHSKSTNEKLDDIVVRLQGLAYGMPAEDAVVFDPVTINQTLQKQVTISLPVAPQTKAFSYSIGQVVTSPVKGVLKSPLTPSKDADIVVNLTCAPTQVESARQSVVVYRKLRDGRIIDSSVIVANTVVKARPVRLKTRFSADTTRMRIADTAVVDVHVVTDDPIDERLEITNVECRVTYNPTIVVPLLAAGQRTEIRGDSMVVVIGGENQNAIRLDEGSTKIASIKFVAVLGDADRSDLNIVSCVADLSGRPAVDLGAATSIVILTNVWRYADGNSRYVNTLQGTLTMDVDPNPIVSVATLRVRNAPSQAGTLVIVEANGRLVADFTQQIRAGKQDFEMSKSTGADVQLSPGTYIARLVVQGADGQNLYSVARLFVVQ
ncbi:MAG: hypothetical protein HQ472_02545 [Ignavibacteria bacterium]|nr:hypothetical protein [Ignavibacteria bacterium]